jgi:hypothetical protein
VPQPARNLIFHLAAQLPYLFNKLTLSVPGLLLTSLAAGVVPYEPPPALVFTTQQQDLRPSLQLQVRQRIDVVKVPQEILQARALRGPEDATVEPLQLFVPKDLGHLEEMASKLAISGSETKLYESMARQGLAAAAATPADQQSSEKVRIVISRDDYALMDPAELAIILSHPHQHVQVPVEQFRKNPGLRRNFLQQMRGFLDRKTRSSVYSKMKQNQTLNLEAELLPAFGQRWVRRFLIHQGPNCFHAALSFQGQSYTKSPFFNVKEERGYHKAMVNYDELWRTLSSSFYEINPRRNRLRYGDMIVFFDVPKNATAHHQVHFRWIRHAATYLFNDLTFSKGSKSASTPYTIKTIGEEWATWQGFSQHMGVKVYRRNSIVARKSPPFDLVDWLY